MSIVKTGVTFVALALASLSIRADIVVIMNPANAAQSLSADQVSSLYLGSATSFPDGAPAVLADQPEAAGIRGDFYQKATGRSAAQVKATWARLTFTGKATPPKELKTDADVKAFVASDPKAIGYIDSSAVDGSVKVALKL